MQQATRKNTVSTKNERIVDSVFSCKKIVSEIQKMRIER